MAANGCNTMAMPNTRQCRVVDLMVGLLYLVYGEGGRT